jgi:predicted HD phosphohydrolase
VIFKVRYEGFVGHFGDFQSSLRRVCHFDKIFKVRYEFWRDFQSSSVKFVTKFVTESVTKFVTKFVMKFVAKFVMKFVTKFATKFVMKFVTKFVMKFVTKFVMKLVMKFVTKFVTEFVTNFVTKFVMKFVTKFVAAPYEFRCYEVRYEVCLRSLSRSSLRSSRELVDIQRVSSFITQGSLVR